MSILSRREIPPRAHQRRSTKEETAVTAEQDSPENLFKSSTHHTLGLSLARPAFVVYRLASQPLTGSIPILQEEMDGKGDSGTGPDAKPPRKREVPPADLSTEFLQTYGMTILRYGIMPALIFASFYMTEASFALLMNVGFWTGCVVMLASLLLLVLWLVRD